MKNMKKQNNISLLSYLTPHVEANNGPCHSISNYSKGRVLLQQLQGLPTKVAVEWTRIL